MTRRILLLTGVALVAFDVVRLTMTGVAVVGAALMVIAAILYRAHTRAFWIYDDPDQAPAVEEQPAREPHPVAAAMAEHLRQRRATLCKIAEISPLYHPQVTIDLHTITEHSPRLADEMIAKLDALTDSERAMVNAVLDVETVIGERVTP